mmetsp:Transcript_43225/g.102994  ORF Transcript_43225/g.102994 Transcript_43225/m.102994 type:complete len:277 (-) Transcript_43225:165-995(-)
MLQLQLTVAAELLLILKGHHAEGIPVAQRRAGTKLRGRVEGEEALAIVEGRDVASGELLNWGLTSEAVLDQHAGHGNHRKPAVVQLGGQLELSLGRVLDLPAPVTSAEVAGLCTVLCIAEASEGLVLQELGLDEAGHQENLQPTLQRNLRHGCDSRRHIGKLQILGWGQVAIELAKNVRPHHADGGNHAETSMLQFHGPASVEVLLGAAILAVADRVPEEQRVTGTNFLRGIVGAADDRCPRGWHNRQAGQAEASQSQAQCTPEPGTCRRPLLRTT